MSIKNFKLTIQYDGTDYSGWQIQKNQKTVQGTLKKCVEKITSHNNVNIVGSGRTDSGVHSLGQVANMKIETNMNNIDIVKSMNSNLPYDIRVIDATIVSDDFSSRFAAVEREYVYKITNILNPFNYKYYWVYAYSYDMDLLNKCADFILKESNFYNFCKHSQDIDHYNCNIYNSAWVKNKNILEYRVSANRFLHHMVRMLVGTMLEVSRGRISFEDFINLFNISDNKKYILTAPSKGLYLLKVKYEK